MSQNIGIQLYAALVLYKWYILPLQTEVKKGSAEIILEHPFFPFSSCPYMPV